jgi:FkbM family methyltransferase
MSLVASGKRFVGKCLYKAKRLLEPEIPKTPDVQCSKETLGNPRYGAWTIQPELIRAESIVYSFGIGEDLSFDLALIEKFGLTVHGFDPTPKSIDWVRSQDLPNLFVLHPYGLADFDGTVSFNPPENPDHVSHTLLDRPETASHSVEVPVKRLQTIMEEMGHRHIDIFKMDIEGAEYQAIDDLLRSGIRPEQLLVEWHHRFPGVGPKATIKSIAQLRAAGYRLFHVSPNQEEYSFVHQDALS